jgi:hypothetical protein
MPRSGLVAYERGSQSSKRGRGFERWEYDEQGNL